MSYRRVSSMIPQSRSRRKEEDFMPAQHRRVSSMQSLQQSRSRRKEAEADIELQLQPDEIVDLMREIYKDSIPKANAGGLKGGFNAATVPGIFGRLTLADLENPNAATVQDIFEYFTHTLLGSSRETVELAMQEVAANAHGNDGGRKAPERVDVLLGFFMEVKRLLRGCGVNDLNLNDLLRPTKKRLVRNLSQVLGLFAFYKPQKATIEEHFDLVEPTVARIEELKVENVEFEQQVKELKENMARIEDDYHEKKERNAEFIERIQPLKQAQEELWMQKERLEQHKQNLRKQIGNGEQELQGLREKIERLQGYLEVGPSTLQDELTALQEELQSAKANVAALERKRRALQTSADSFDKVSEQLEACIKVMGEIGVEREREEDVAAQCNALGETLANGQKEAREVESRLASLEPLPGAWEEQIRELDDQMTVDKRETMQRISDLKKMHEQLMRDYDKKKEELQQKKMRVENIRKLTRSLEDAITRDNEAMHNEYIPIKSHINSYINVMDPILDEDGRPSRWT